MLSKITKLFLGVVAIGFCSRFSIGQTSKKTTASMPKNSATGVIQAMDASAATVTLHPKTGSDTVYKFTDKTHFLRNKSAKDIQAFKLGDEIVVRYRKSAVGPSTLYDLMDTASWAWMNKIRHETTKGVIKSATADEMIILEGSDKSEITYSASEKTAWNRDGKSASASDFKPGDTVFVAPRLLPSGNLMATAVTSDMKTLTLAKERSKSVLSAVVKTVMVDKKILVFRTSGGEDREAPLAEGCTIHQSGKDVPLSNLKPFTNVTLHFKKTSEGTQEISAITISVTKSSKPASTSKSGVMKP